MPVAELESTLQVSDQTTLVPDSTEQALLVQSENLGIEIKQAQDSFSLSVGTTIQHACEIGRIAFEARECIRSLPTKLDKARLAKTHVSNVDYKKPTFNQWIESYTGIGKATIYSMIQLYEKLKDNQDYEIPEDMSWQDCLAHLSGRKVQSFSELKSANDESVDEGIKDKINDENNEKDNQDDVIETSLKDAKDEGKELIKTYEKIDKMFARSLGTLKNEKFKAIITRWKNYLANEISKEEILSDN